jgi:uncharacterized protein
MLRNILSFSRACAAVIARRAAASIAASVLAIGAGQAMAAGTAKQSPTPAATAAAPIAPPAATIAPAAKPMSAAAASKYGATDCANPALPRSILAAPAAVSSPPPLKTETIVAPKAHLRVAVAATEAQRESGLMCVTKLATHAGMIFIFDRNDPVTFWMKHTLIPLDMVWLDTHGRVTTVAARVPAATLQTPDAQVARRSGTGRYVIELNSGEAAKDGIHTGVRLKLPA